MLLVGRSCGISTNSTAECKTVASTETCHCNGELCNSAGFAKVSLVALLATIVVPFILSQ